MNNINKILIHLIEEHHIVVEYVRNAKHYKINKDNISDFDILEFSYIHLKNKNFDKTIFIDLKIIDQLNIIKSEIIYNSFYEANKDRSFYEFIKSSKNTLIEDIQDRCGFANVSFLEELNLEDLITLQGMLKNKYFIYSLIEKYYLGEVSNQEIKDKWENDTSYIIKDEKGFFVSSYGQSCGSLFYHHSLDDAINFIFATKFINTIYWRNKNISNNF